MTKKQYKRGDILYVNFPYSDLTIMKLRPALVVESDSLNTGTPSIIIVPFTSQQHQNNDPARVLISLSDPKYAKTTGLKKDSVVMADRIMALDLKYVQKKAGELPYMGAVDNALRVALSL